MLAYKLTLKQFNRQLKATASSLTASFPFHPTITKKIKKSLASHDVKVTSSQGLPFGTYSPKRRPHLLNSIPTSFMKFLVMTARRQSHKFTGTTLRDLLTKTKTTPPQLTPNVIYEIYCDDFTDVQDVV